MHRVDLLVETAMAQTRTPLPGGRDATLTSARRPLNVAGDLAYIKILPLYYFSSRFQILKAGGCASEFYRGLSQFKQPEARTHMQSKPAVI